MCWSSPATAITAMCTTQITSVSHLWAIGPIASTISPLIFCMAERNRQSRFFCSSARSSRIIRMTVGGMKGRTARGRSLRIFSLRGIWRPAQEPVHRARTSAIGGKIIPIIWGAVTAWITTLDVWLIRSKSRECGKTLSLSTRRITAAIF